MPMDKRNKKKKNNKRFNIPKVTHSENNKILSPEIANHAVKDQQFYNVSFSSYKIKRCELEELNSASYKKALKWIKSVCLCTSFDEIRKIGNGDTVDNEDDYAFLFNGLPKGTNIKEYKLAATDRIFYYIDDAYRMINFVLFKNSHLETEKTRRK